MENLTKKTKTTLWLALMAAVVVIAIMVYRRLKTEKGYTDTRAGLYNCQNTRNARFPLMMGSNGWQVELLQRIHNNNPDWDAEPLTTDGIWGSKTNRAFLDSFGQTIFGQESFETYIRYYDIYLHQ